MKDVKFHNNTEREALEYTSKVVDFGVALLVYAALNELLNAYVLLSHSKYFKHTIKRRAKEALRQRNSKVYELKHLVMRGDFAECYWDAVIDACEEDVELFRSEIKATLDEAQVPDAELYSQMEVARVMLEAAKIEYEEVIKDSTQQFKEINEREMKNLNLFAIFHEFYIAGLSREWNIICDELYESKGKTVDLSNERTKAAFDIMAEKFEKGLYVDTCLQVAKEVYPEFSNARIITEE